jgi:ribonuclease HI
MVWRTMVGVYGEVKAGKKVRLTFVPGHASVRRNEHADRLAGIATVKSDY